jgi:pimeloyl-ACP methyl ester carboxylesterase
MAFSVMYKEALRFGDHAVQRLAFSSGFDGASDWVLVCEPAGGARLWAVVLHGHGSGGDQVFTRKDIQDWSCRLSALGMGILSPNLRGNAWMGPAATADLRALLDYVRQAFGAERFVFCSGSMGGTGNLCFAVQHPEDVAGVVALCPVTDIETYYRWVAGKSAPILQEIAGAIRASYGGTPEEAFAVYAERSVCRRCDQLTMPVAIVHGDRDGMIPVEQSRRLVECLRTRGAEVWYEELPGGNHDAPLRVFDAALDAVLGRL